MPRPFPVPFNIGTDICSIPRIFNILKGGNGRKFIKRVLNEREREEGLERLDRPVERWRRAVRASVVLEWKREELGLTLKELNRRRHRAFGIALDVGRLGKKSTLLDTEALRRELEREVRAEEVSQIKALEEIERERERVLVGDSAITFGEENTETARDEGWEELVESEVTEDPKTLVEVSEDVSPAELKKKRLEDADNMIRLMDDNEKELAVAKEGLEKAAEFMAGRFAAKEAAIKAHHYRKLTYHSIAIHRPPSTDLKEGSQPPIAVILTESGDWEEGEEVKISISHDTDYATAVCLAYEGDPKVQKRESYREGAVISRNLRSATTGTVSESNREIFEQLEMDGVDLEEEVEDSTWKETMNALEDRERKRAAISDPKRLVKVENLSEEVTEEDLLELFKGRSQKLKTLIPRDGEGKRLGYGLVSFRTARDAVTSRLKLDRTMLKGEKIICRWLGNRKARTRGLGVGGKGLFKGEDPGRWVEPVQTKDA